MALSSICHLLALSFLAAPPAATSAQTPDTTSNQPAAQSFDPKVRRIGVQTLDEAPPPEQDVPENHQAQPDPVAPILPYTTPETRNDKAQGDASCRGEKADCDPKPSFKLGAQLLLIPIQDTGINGTKDITQRRILQRARLSASAHWRSIGLKVDIQDVRQWGQGNNPAASANFVNLSLYQGYMELVGKSEERGYRSFFRVGRQAIAWGDQRLMGYGEWTIHGRSHDAVRAFVGIRDFEVDLFWSVRRPSTEPGAAARNSGAHLGGLRLASLHLKPLSAELVGLLHHNDGDTPQSTDTLGNVGLRVFGTPLPALNYSLEANYQFGNRNTLTHRAWAVAGRAGWRQPFSAGLTFRLELGASAASGNQNGTKSREFFNFYPANHLWYGIMDRIGWRNMVDYELQAGIDFAKNVNLGAAYHFIALQSAQGAWKNAGGATITPGNANNKTGLGSEIDLIANYRPLKAFWLQLGYGLWIPTQAGYERLSVARGQRRVQQRLFLLLKAQL